MPKISELPSTSEANSSDELPIVQTGTTKRTTVGTLLADITADLTSHTSNTSNPHSTNAAQVGAIATTEKGAANGVATLDANTLIPTTQIPTSIARVTDITAAQVNNTTAQWNANQIQGIPVSSTAPTNGQILKFNGTQYVPSADNEGSGGGGSSMWDSLQFLNGTGIYYSQLISVANSASISTSANQARISPLFIKRACSIDRVRVNVVTAVTGGLVNVLLYDSTGTLVGNFGDISASGNNLRETDVLTTPVSIQPGVYYWYLIPNNTINMTGFNNTTSPIFTDIFGVASINNSNLGGFVASFTFGTAPSSVTLPAMTSTSALIVHYRVSSLP